MVLSSQCQFTRPGYQLSGCSGRNRREDCGSLAWGKSRILPTLFRWQQGIGNRDAVLLEQFLAIPFDFRHPPLGLLLEDFIVN